MFSPSNSRPESMYVPHIRTILSSLEFIANQVRTNPYFCQNMEKQLKDCGYHWFGSEFGSSASSGDSEQVMKVLAMTVNEAIQKKVDLKNQFSVKQELHQLLDIDVDKSLGHYFFFELDFPYRTWERMLQTAISPLDMAKFLQKSTPQWLVKKMIEHQFDIKWNTQPPNYEPDNYSFYEFCDEAEKTTEPKDFNFFKYTPRLAHVKATLYKECRRNVYYLRSISKEELCPIVYIRVADGWIAWQADRGVTSKRVSDEDGDLRWIDPSIRNFITENADEQKIEYLEDSLTKPTLYWAVLEDRDFMSGEKLKLKPIGQTQVYVGKASNGIQKRWIKGNNHCAMMKKCLDDVCAMTTYDPSILEGIQLVDARLALAKVREERTALFVIKTFGDDIEKAEIVQQKAEECLDEAQRCVNHEQARIVYLQTAPWRFPVTPMLTFPHQTYLQTGLGRFNTTFMREALCQVAPSRLNELEAEVEKKQEELDEAKAVLDDLKNSKTSKAEAEAQLTRAEKLHRMGKRIHDSRKNIIPHKDYQTSWKPKDMGYGMNFN